MPWHFSFSESLDFHKKPKVSKKHYFQLIYELEKKLKKKGSNILTNFQIQLVT